MGVIPTKETVKPPLGGTALAGLRLRKMAYELNSKQMHKMVVLIQNRRTSAYLEADNLWTTDISKACHFDDIENAFSYLEKSGSPDLQVLVVPDPTKEDSQD